MPSGQNIDIRFLKTLEYHKLVPIAYCPKGVIDQVKNFVPGYLARTTKRLWEVYDEEDYIIETIYWDEGNDALLNKFGTSIQHPEDHFVQYFDGTKLTLIEKDGPRRSPRKNPTETHNTDERGLSSLASPGRGGVDLPGQGEAKRTTIKGKRVREGWTRMPPVSVRGRKRLAKGASAHQLRYIIRN